MRISSSEITLMTTTTVEDDLAVEGHVTVDDHIKVQNNTGYIAVQATNTGLESRMSLGTVETASVYANAYLTNSDVNSAITSMVTMLAWSVTDNAIQINASGKSARFEVYDDNSQIPIASNEDGKVYLGTLNGEPQYPNFEWQTGNGVYIEGNDSDGMALIVTNRSVNTNSDGVAIILGEGAYGHSEGYSDYPGTSNRFIKFYSKQKPYNSSGGLPNQVPIQLGYVRGDGSGGVAYIESFTGIHASILDTSEITEGAVPGMILESTGAIWHTASGENVSTALPKVQLSSTEKSKKVYGVIGALTSEFYGYIQASPLSEKETSIEVNAIGEGKVWVTNIKGNLENGDYVTSSSIKGFGQLQDDDILHSYTVAKITERINWNEVTEEIVFNGVSYKKYLSACTYHCG